MVPKNKLSPHVLLQELFWPDRWKCLVACILLNRTKRKQVDAIRDELFEFAPTAEDMATCDIDKLIEIIRPLGFYNIRASTLIKMSRSFLSGVNIKDLPGIGLYGHSSDRIFFNDEINIDVDDHALVKYVVWRRTKQFKLNKKSVVNKY